MKLPALINYMPTLGIKGSYVIHGTTTLSALADGTARWIMKFKSEAPYNYIDCFKSANSNELGWQHKDDGTDDIYRTHEWELPSRFSLGSTWSVDNGVKFFFNGLVGASGADITGVWTCAFNYLGAALGSNDNTTGYEAAWIGNVGDFAIWDDELTEAEMRNVGW